MYRKMMDFLIIERPFGSKILLALAALAIALSIQGGQGAKSPVAQDLQHIASLPMWLVFLGGYSITLLYGVFWGNSTAKLLASIGGIFIWFGLFGFHTIMSGVGPLRGCYFVFGLFSVWHTLIVLEQIRMMREHGVDMIKISNDIQMQYLKKYRREK